MNDMIFPRFWSVKEKHYIYPNTYMQSAFNRSTAEGEFGLLYKLFVNSVDYIPELPTGFTVENGSYIYEGDIVKCGRTVSVSRDNPYDEDEYIEKIGVVQYDSDRAKFVVTYGVDLNSHELDFEDLNEGVIGNCDITVIGNIHDAKEQE